jgi:hypothetical protein
VTVVGRLDDPLTLQRLDSQGLTIGIENPDLQTAAALTEMLAPRTAASAEFSSLVRLATHTVRASCNSHRSCESGCAPEADDLCRNSASVGNLT